MSRMRRNILVIIADQLSQKALGCYGDPFESLPVKANARWRSHAPGYGNHTGPAAPEA